MYRRQLMRTCRRLLSRRSWRMRLLSWGCAVGVGAASAAFALIAGYSEGLFHRLHDHAPWLAYAVTPLGLAAIAYATQRFFRGSEGSGIPQTIAALSLHTHGQRARLLSLRLALAKILLTSLGLACGASIGREGPTVHVGASLMYAVRHVVPLHSRQANRALILAGGAAGITAAFNTPLAGLLFAIEEMSRSYEQRNSGTLVISVVLAGITALVILGNYTYFGTTNAVLPLDTVLPAVLMCGVAGGALGGIFSTALIEGSRRIAPLARRHPVALAFACGLLLSLIGWLSTGTTYGTGYETARQLVEGQNDVVGHPFLKLLATVVSYLSGIPGGIFSPSLAVGAGLGADLAPMLPSAPSAAIVILGMVGYFTGVVQAPITAFVIVMEMNGDSAMLLPLMATALVANGISRLLCPRPIYQALADAYLAAAPTRHPSIPRPV